MTLQEIYVRVAEGLGWKVSVDDEDKTWEFEKWSPAGEDVIVSAYSGSVAEDVMVYYKNFDPEEHITDLLIAKRNGFTGVPGVKTLVDDADEVVDMLCELAYGLEEVEKESRRRYCNCRDCGAFVLKDIFFDGDIPVWVCPKCGTVKEDHSWYCYVNQEQASEIIETRKPLGKFVQDTGVEYIGIDNSDGNAWTEEFPDLRECLEWLL